MVPEGKHGMEIKGHYKINLSPCCIDKLNVDEALC